MRGRARRNGDWRKVRAREETGEAERTPHLRKWVGFGAVPAGKLRDCGRQGAIIGRTAIAGSQSYLTGAVALCTLVAIHGLASVLRFRPVPGKLVDHRIRVLVAEASCGDGS